MELKENTGTLFYYCILSDLGLEEKEHKRIVLALRYNLNLATKFS